MSKATTTVKLTGTIYKIEMRKEAWYLYSRQPRWAQGEYYGYKAMVGVETDDGERFWFYSPRAQFSIQNGGPYYVSVLHENDWIVKAEEKWDVKGAFDGAGFGDLPALAHKVGDRITITGRPKRETRFGMRYTHVKLIEETSHEQSRV